MSKILISLLFVVLLFVGSCGEINTGDSGNTGNTDDSGDNFPNEHDGLNWSDVSSDKMNWNDATSYCQNLGGRLPTISELRTLIQNCPGTETGGECGVTDSCLSWQDCRNDACDGCEYDDSGKYSVFGGYAYWFWSSSERSDDAGVFWHVGFQGGNVYSAYKHDHGYVRCVK